ncbi:MAG: rhodanese-like domain-containing protein [Novipirellula sp. JB048]
MRGNVISIGDLISRLCNVGFGTMELLRRMLGRPRVGTITSSQLWAALNADETPVVLVDVRSDQELAVSRIPGAITPQEYEAAAADLAGRPVVAYCTVGGRSYLYARRLVSGGVPAMNYRDGIIGWCRAGLPLESPDHQPTHAVHPYWRIFRVPDQYDVKS